MDREDQAQRGSRSNGKRSKDKKIPQRGLGVAQLEKIRLEEQRKTVSNDHNSTQSSSRPSDISFVSPSNSTFRLMHNIDTKRPNSYAHHEQEFNPIWSDPSHQYQQPIPNMVNVTTQCSSLSSFQIEPPSNQIFYGNSTNIISSDQDKILGNKRPYQFVDNQPCSSFHFGFTYFSNNNPNHSHSNLSELGFPWRSSNSIPEPNSKKSSATNTFDREIHNFETISSQGIENNWNIPSEPSGSTQHIRVYSFFPPAKKLNYESAATETHYCNDGFNENVDLNLKL